MTPTESSYWVLVAVFDDIGDLVSSVAVRNDLRERPVDAVEDGVVAVVGQRVLVRSLVEFALLDETEFDEFVEVRVETPVVDFGSVVILEFPLYFCQESATRRG
ncbi:hypothetical protein EL22_28025 [Halostagnicola sp. A56]|nr:hypothetical protein EL22_28025 [Halostagnicola sp. A56]